MVMVHETACACRMFPAVDERRHTDYAGRWEHRPRARPEADERILHARTTPEGDYLVAILEAASPTAAQRSVPP